MQQLTAASHQKELVQAKPAKNNSLNIEQP